MSEASPLDRFVSVRRHLDLFSGIGGFALAAQWAGFETVAFCEIEDFPRKVLEKNFPCVPIHRDIRDLDGTNYAGIELITGGYPCQPFSSIGAQKGKDDPRHLWPEMLRIIKQARPTWVVAENVARHVTNGLDTVLHDLESEGYAARPIIIPACAVGAPHQRDRLWVVANAESKRKHGTVAERGRTEAENEGSRRHSDRELVRSDAGGPEGGWRRGWSAEPRIYGLVDGIPNRVGRNRAYGNAIVPQVAYQILRAIRAH